MGYASIIDRCKCQRIKWMVVNDKKGLPEAKVLSSNTLFGAGVPTVVDEQSRWLLHGPGGPGFESR